MDKIFEKYIKECLYPYDYKDARLKKIIKGTLHYKYFVLNYHWNEIKKEIFNIIFRRK